MAFADALTVHREAINNLNVYPVPDGDTGTNMSLTLRSVVEEIESREDEMVSLCEGIAHGSLMGARGNSGVIMSQILRELSQAIAAYSTIDGAVLANGLAAAAKGAYEAVGKPVEGTILTVIRESAEAAAVAVAQGEELCGVLSAARDEAMASLERTPTLLSVLADAGVVDAGGAGLLLLYHAALHIVDGQPIPEPKVTSPLEARPPTPAVAPKSETSIADLRYEVMFLLDAADEKIAGFKEAWSLVGDSIVVVGGGGLHNCHIHCDDIGAAIECAIAVGRPHKIRVTDLLDELTQNEEQHWVVEALEPSEAHQTTVRTAVVAVGVGSGVAELFESLGVQVVVAGGQSMNPSTKELLAAVESVQAPEVIILPNNKNIIPVAQQVDQHSTRTVVVVGTTSVPEALGCLMAYDPQSGAAGNAESMAQTARTVQSGEVTQAVRNANSDVGVINEGDWLGICPQGIMAVASEMFDAVVGLLTEIIHADHELLTIISGASADDQITASIEGWVNRNHPTLDVESHFGGQPLYPYFFGLE